MKDQDMYMKIYGFITNMFLNKDYGTELRIELWDDDYAQIFWSECNQWINVQVQNDNDSHVDGWWLMILDDMFEWPEDENWIFYTDNDVDDKEISHILSHIKDSADFIYELCFMR